MGITHLVARESTDTNLVDEHPACEPVIDDAAPFMTPAQRTGREAHQREGSDRRIRSMTADTGHTCRVTTGSPLDVVTYGSGLPSEAELRLCGDLSGGRRAVELGVSDERNSIAFATLGAKAIAVDPDPERIASLRRTATERGLHIECHVGELADLGFVTSGSVEVVVAHRTLAEVDDLGRLLRQVHRVLRPSHSFVLAIAHPFHALIDELGHGRVPTPYGEAERTIGDWFVALNRTNFRVDTMLELGSTPGTPAPSTLILRAHKEGS